MNRQYRQGVVLLLVTLLLAACGSPGRVGQTSPPTVVMISPSDGQQVRQGEQMPIQVTVTDTQGVARVEMGVDGVLLHTVENPSPAANAPFDVRQTWTADALGSHSVMVVAYNTAGIASSPVLVDVTVVESDAPLPPSPTTDSSSPGAAPTPTWTPISISAGPSPTPPPPPPPGSPSPSPTVTSKPPSGGGATRPSAPGPITGFETFGAWKRGDQPNGTFTQSSEHVHSGDHAGKLAYNFPTGNNDFVVFLQSFKLGGQPNQISAWVFGDGGKHYLNVWIKDAAGETWQFTLGQVKHTGWGQMTAWLDPAASWPAGHIDGPSNGALDYPVDFRALVLDDVPDSYSGSGAIFLDDLRCDQASAPPPTATSTPEPTTGATSVNFRADEYTITSGHCTRLRWDVDNAREVYLDGEGVVGHDKRKVCPTTTTTYRLKVIRLDGGTEIYELTITVV